MTDSNQAFTNAVVQVVVDSKKFYLSKTFWVNVIALAAIGIQSKWGFVVDVELQAMVLGLVNLGLRTVTNQSIVW